MDAFAPDDYDRQLLALVQEDAAAPAEALARQVPLSPSAIQRRLKRLREKGFIERHAAVLDPDRVGGLTFFMAFLHVAHEHAPAANGLKEWIGRRREVQQAWYVTGDDDFVLLVCASGVQAY
ncbi:MAG: Lrp/AsnC family transcriptional regulator, partial [Burkholderiaceae bacterium]